MAKKEQQNKTNLKKITNESLANVSGGYTIETIVVGQGYFVYTDPKTGEQIRSKPMNKYQYKVTGINGTKIFNNLQDAIEWAEDYADFIPSSDSK